MKKNISVAAQLMVLAMSASFACWTTIVPIMILSLFICACVALVIAAEIDK